MYKTQQKELYEKICTLVPFDGWKTSTLRQASKEAGFEENFVDIIFPGGIKDIISYQNKLLNKQMVEQLKKENLSKLKIREKIALAVKIRISCYQDKKALVKKTTTYLSMPQNLAFSATLIWQTVDTIWHAVGDTSTDFNYYTKRTLLAAIYSSTLLYWLKDNSEDQKNSWDFLKRRIDNVMTINKAKAKCGVWFQKNN